MKPSLSVVLAVVVPLLAVVVGCGGEEFSEVTSGPDRVNAKACPAEGCSSSDASEIIALLQPLHLELENAAASTRICQLTYKHLEWDGTTTSGTVLAAVPVLAGETRYADVWVPWNQTVTVTAACWVPEPFVKGANSITTPPMRDSRTCRAIYDESSGANMAIPCWQ